MAAAPFKANMVVALGSQRGAPKFIPLTVSDVNGEFAIFPSGSSESILHGQKDVYIIDIVLSAAGTDTSQMEYFLNSISSGQKSLNATMLATAVNRPFQQAPFRVPAGAMIKIKQLT